MPTISRFFGIVIVMFSDDHGFPHFHARHAEGEAKVRWAELHMRGPVFEDARTLAGFARVETETGTVVWPGGADLAPDTLYERVRSGAWPNSRAAA